MADFIIEAIRFLILLGGSIATAALLLLAWSFWTGDVYDWHQEGRDNG